MCRIPNPLAHSTNVCSILKVQTQIRPVIGETAPADNGDLRALNDWGDGSLVVIALAVVPADLPDSVVRIDKVDTHVDGTVAGSKAGGCNGRTWRCPVKDGDEVRVPAFVRVVGSLDEFEVISLEPDPVYVKY